MIGCDFSKARALIVDDSAYMRKVLVRLLQLFGFERLLEARDGRDALARLEINECDIVFVDWEMPMMDGIEMTRLLRNGLDKKHVHVPIIMISSYSDPKKVLAARDAGINEFIVKPIAPQVLFSRIWSVIERPRAFVRTADFFGPDRRRKKPEAYTGEERRQTVVDGLEDDLNALGLSQEDVDSLMYPNREGGGERR